MTTLSPLAWPEFSALGKPMSPEFVAQWFDGKASKKDWQFNKKKGLAVSLDHHQRIVALHLFSKGVEKSAVSAALPGDLAWSMTDRI
jgi:hypothetical protein